MIQKKLKLFFFTIILLFSIVTQSYSEIVKEIKVSGNKRITQETIQMFSGISLKDNLDKDEINNILKLLYETNFFSDVELVFNNNILKINVKENPIIDKIIFTGIKADKIKNAISKNLLLKSRSSLNLSILKSDKQNIINSLNELGYYFSKIDISIEEMGDNIITLNYNINLGKKSKIKKISFIGKKIFKDSKLRSVIISEEYKFWKFISGRKFLNENTLDIDKRLLKNFYLSKGFFNTSINSSFAKLIDDDQFELIFNIDAGEKVYFDNINLNIPVDFEEENFKDLRNVLKDVKGEVYSLYSVNKILEKIDTITTTEEYHSTIATVNESLVGDKINLEFNIEETEKFFIEKINIFGNNITHESVIRNKLEIDEGDPFNEILHAKSINNIKSLNFFKSVSSKIIQNNKLNTKIINIYIEEKATGEISAGAGVGTNGGTIALGIKENNYLGRGISVDATGTLTEESLKGMLQIRNPNYKNSDKSVNFSIQALEVDRISDFGYKNNKIGFALGTDFEYLDDFKLGLQTSSFYEKIETDSTASSMQKKQEGNYFDTFLNINFDHDKRNQIFQTTEGYRTRYSIDLPVISKTNTLTNSFNYKIYKELYEQNISTMSIMLQAAKSITNDDIKLSERLFIPSSKLRGFEKGRTGPKDGNDFIGGNFVSTLNFTSTIPQVLENAQNVDVALFFDVANIWGVDYDSTLANSNKIRSSLGVGLDWFTILGPLNFSLALPLTKDQGDITETFRFNIGTTF